LWTRCFSFLCLNDDSFLALWTNHFSFWSWSMLPHVCYFCWTFLVI
jgi:hypothetical protein